MAGAYKSKNAKKYIGWYYDAARRRVRFTGFADKTATVALAEKREKDAALEREGLVTPLDKSKKAAAVLPIDEHIEEYRLSLIAKGRTEKHARHIKGALHKLCVDGAIRMLPQFAAVSIERGLDALKTDGYSARTHNHARNAAKAFARWLWERGKIGDPIRGLDGLGLLNQESDRRWVRRALTPEQLDRLIRAAENGKPVVLSRIGYQYDHREISGSDRAMLYRVAAGTGFRANEIRTLTADAFDLGDNPSILVKAAYAKNRREVRQPIARSLAAALRPWLASRRPGLVFDLPERLAKLLRVDLAAAGIPFEGAAGVVDFHALRATYATNLIRRGVSLVEAQKLMRHSTPDLTANVYTKLTDDEIRKALED